LALSADRAGLMVHSWRRW